MGKNLEEIASEATEISLTSRGGQKSQLVEKMKTLFGIKPNGTGRGVLTDVCLTQGDIKYALNEALDADIDHPSPLNNKLLGAYGYRNYIKVQDDGTTKEFVQDESKRFEEQRILRAVKTNSSNYPLWEVNPDSPLVEEAIEERGEAEVSNAKEFKEYLEELKNASEEE